MNKKNYAQYVFDNKNLKSWDVFFIFYFWIFHFFIAKCFSNSVITAIFVNFPLVLFWFSAQSSSFLLVVKFFGSFFSLFFLKKIFKLKGPKGLFIVRRSSENFTNEKAWDLFKNLIQVFPAIEKNVHRAGSTKIPYFLSFIFCLELKSVEDLNLYLAE